MTTHYKIEMYIFMILYCTAPTAMTPLSEGTSDPRPLSPSWVFYRSCYCYCYRYHYRCFAHHCSAHYCTAHHCTAHHCSVLLIYEVRWRYVTWSEGTKGQMTLSQLAAWSNLLALTVSLYLRALERTANLNVEPEKVNLDKHCTGAIH